MSTTEELNLEEELKKIEEEILQHDPHLIQKNGVQSGSSVLMEFIKQAFAGKIDMSNLQTPSFMIKPIPQLEQGADYSYPFDFFLQIPELDSPVDRLVALSRYFIECGKMTYCKSFSKIAPLMPILGENFYCHWDHQDGSKTTYFAEKVTESITCSHIENVDKGISITSSVKYASAFYGNSAACLTKGGGVIKLKDETYECTFPGGIAYGIFWGTSKIEPYDKLVMKSDKHDFYVDLSFDHGLSVDGYVYNGKKKVRRIQGTLDDKVYVINLEKNNDKQILLTADFHEVYKKKKVAPLHKQKDHESRKVWHRVNYHLLREEHSEAVKHRDLVFEKQKTTHEPFHFVETKKIINEVPLYDVLIEKHPFK